MRDTLDDRHFMFHFRCSALQMQGGACGQPLQRLTITPAALPNGTSETPTAKPFRRVFLSRKENTTPRSRAMNAPKPFKLRASHLGRLTPPETAIGPSFY